MIVLELDRVEIDYCPDCGGVWLDRGELELLLGSGAGLEWLRAAGESAAEAEKGRSCPVCRKRMEKCLFGGPCQVRVDRCSRGDGIWLDRGELEQLLEGSSGEKGRVLDLLKDLFGTVKPGGNL